MQSLPMGMLAMHPAVGEKTERKTENKLKFTHPKPLLATAPSEYVLESEADKHHWMDVHSSAANSPWSENSPCGRAGQTGPAQPSPAGGNCRNLSPKAVTSLSSLYS